MLMLWFLLLLTALGRALFSAALFFRSEGRALLATSMRKAEMAGRLEDSKPGAGRNPASPARDDSYPFRRAVSRIRCVAFGLSRVLLPTDSAEPTGPLLRVFAGASGVAGPGSRAAPRREFACCIAVPADFDALRRRPRHVAANRIHDRPGAHVSHEREPELRALPNS